MTRKLVAFLCLVGGTARAQETAPTASSSSGSDVLASLFAAGAGLTADEVARRAAASSTVTRSKQRAVEVAAARQSAADAGYWPRLTGTARYTRLSHLSPVQLADPRVAFVGRVGPPGPVTPGDALTAFAFPPFTVPDNQYLTEASLTVPISDYVLRVSQGIAAAAHSLRAAQIDEQATRLTAAADGRVAYYQWIRARGQALIAAQALEQSAGHLRDAEQMLAAGVASKADTLRAESQVKAAELLLTRARNTATLAEERLRVFTHDPGSRPYQVGEDITLPLPLPAEDATLSDLVDEAIGRRLELRALAETAGAVHALGKVARAAQYPRLDVTGNAVYANPNPRIFPAQPKFDATWDASVVLSWTPTDIAGARSAARERAAEESEILVEREALLDGLRLEIAEALNAEREAAVALGTTRQGLQAAEESYRVRRDLFRGGKATLVEVDDAQTELTRARLEIVNAHIDARIARVRLAHAVGRDAPP